MYNHKQKDLLVKQSHLEMEEQRKRRMTMMMTWKRKRKAELEQGSRGRVRGCGRGRSELQNPLEVLGLDIMMEIMKLQDARSVALCLLVSHSWNSIASTDTLWASKCEELWVGKAHVPGLSQTQGLSKLAVYSLSVMDGKRDRIMRADLCDHAWEFHFTKAAPEYWQEQDPYWIGTKPLMHRYFHPDGTQTADPDDKVWGGHECCYSLRKHHVRINRWLHLDVTRNHDWSWELSSDIFSYSSVPDHTTSH